MRIRRPLDRRILALALPAAGSAMVPVVHRMVDMAWIRGLGTNAVAALGISSISVWLFAAVAWFVAMGLTALTARYAGAFRREAAGYVAGQGLRWALAVGLACAVVGWFLAPAVFSLGGAEEAVRALGVRYTRIYWAGGAFVLVQVASDAIFRAHGNTRTPLRIAAAALALNVALDPLLIWGWGPVPRLEVAGAGLATVVAAAAGAGLSLLALLRHGHLRRAHPGEAALRLDAGTRVGRPGFLGLDRAVFVRLARVGSPTMTANLLFNLILLEMMRMAESAGGRAAQAGLTIGHTGEGLVYVIGLGWAAAAGALVGRRLGAGQPRAAERAAWRASVQCGLLNLGYALLLLVLADPIAWIWAKDPVAQAHGASYLRIVAWCLVPQAYGIVLDGAFGGAGMTVPPMVAGVLLAAARVPLGWWVVEDLGWGVAGIWIVISVTAGVRGLVVAYWFSRGTWKVRSV